MKKTRITNFELNDSLPEPMTDEEAHDIALNAASEAALRMAMAIAQGQKKAGSRDNRDLFAMARLLNLAAELLEEKTK